MQGFAEGHCLRCPRMNLFHHQQRYGVTTAEIIGRERRHSKHILQNSPNQTLEARSPACEAECPKRSSRCVVQLLNDGTPFAEHGLPMLNAQPNESEEKQPYRIAAASTSTREVNEDSYFVGCLKPSMQVQEASSGVRLRGEISGSNRGVLMIVADGLGGLNHGGLASKLAVEEAACFTMEHVTAPRWKSYSKKASYSSEVTQRLSIPGIREQLADVVAASDHVLRQEALTKGELGSTLTLGYLLWPLLYVAHVGDSRAYVIRNRQLLQVTKDHSLGAQATSLGLDHIAGEWHDALWNCLGDANRCAAPDLHKVILDAHDRWLFTSDGFHKFVTPKEIVDLALSSSDATTACNALVRRAVHNGANDDVTVIFGHYSG